LVDIIKCSEKGHTVLPKIGQIGPKMDNSPDECSIIKLSVWSSSFMMAGKVSVVLPKVDFYFNVVSF
jgi:hypothetical protein